MCGRFASYVPVDALRAMFESENAPVNLAPNWNVAPTQVAAVVRRHPQSGARHLDLLQWGLVPHFTGALATARRPINARSETVAGSGMFRAAFERRRCLVPADAFYEWKAGADGKQPYAIGRRDGRTLALAGVWEGWRSPEGEVVRSFAILTTRANGTLGWLHERMPVILEAADWAVWLGEAEGDAGALMRPAGEDVVRSWAVGRAVNSVRNNGAALLDGVGEREGAGG